MANTLLLREFQRVFKETTTLDSVVPINSISAQADFCLKSFKALQQAYIRLDATKATLIEKVHAFENIDKKPANACKLVKQGHNALNQVLGAYKLYKNLNAELTRQL